MSGLPSCKVFDCYFGNVPASQFLYHSISETGAVSSIILTDILRNPPQFGPLTELVFKTWQNSSYKLIIHQFAEKFGAYFARWMFVSWFAKLANGTRSDPFQCRPHPDVLYVSIRPDWMFSSHLLFNVLNVNFPWVFLSTVLHAFLIFPCALRASPSLFPSYNHRTIC